MHEHSTYVVTQTRRIEIVADDPADAVDAARYFLRGEIPPESVTGTRNSPIKILKLECVAKSDD